MTLTSVGLITAALACPQVLSESIAASLGDSASRIIPSLFPMMVLSKFMVESGALGIFEKYLGGIISRLFDVSRASAGAVFLGLISGFPVGAATVCELYKNGSISRDEAEKALIGAHNAGPAFPVIAIGISLWGSKCYGIMLYASQILSAVIISRTLPKSDYNRLDSFKMSRSGRSIGTSLVSAIASASMSCVSVVGFITFWRGLTDIIFSLIGEGHISYTAAVTFEFASGSLYASKLSMPYSALLTGFSLGFSGLSAICQAHSFTSKNFLSSKKLIFGKLLQGILCAIFSLAAYFVVF